MTNHAHETGQTAQGGRQGSCESAAVARTTLISFLRERKDEISVLVSIASLLIVALGFLATWKQAHRATEELQAANVYQIQKDARQLNSEVFTTSYRKVLDLPGKTTYFVLMDVPDKTTHFVLRGIDNRSPNVVVLDENFQEGTWKMFNFYIAVYRQAQYGMLPNEFARDYARDFCLLWTKVPAEMVWNNIIRRYKKSDRSQTNLNVTEGLDYAQVPKDWCDS